MMKKYILLAVLSLTLWSCAEDEIKPYHGGQYIYLSQLLPNEKCESIENISISFNNYPGQDELEVKVGLGLIGTLFAEATPYKVEVVDVDDTEETIKNANPANYRLPAETKFLPNAVNDVLVVTLIKTDDLKENVRLRLRLVPNEYFAGPMEQYGQIDIIFNNVVSAPLWWESGSDTEKLFLGEWSAKKHQAFYECTQIADFGALSTAEKREAALKFKYYIAEHNLTEEDGTPMTVPVS